MPQALCDHIIVCGFGAVGRVVTRELQHAEARYVVIGTKTDAELASILGIHIVRGDPSRRDSLLAAGIERACALVACTESDEQNLATTRTARELRADLAISACLVGESGEQELTRAGADSVVSTATAGGVELARRALHPATGAPPDAGFRVAQLTVVAGSSGAGHSISALRGGAFVVGLRRATGAFLPLPPGETVLRPGDMVMALGTPATLARIEQLLVTRHQLGPPPAAMGLPRTTRRL